MTRVPWPICSAALRSCRTSVPAKNEGTKDDVQRRDALPELDGFGQQAEQPRRSQEDEQGPPPGRVGRAEAEDEGGPRGGQGQVGGQAGAEGARGAASVH